MPGEFNGQKSLVGYSPWGVKESDTTEQLTLTCWCFIYTFTHPNTHTHTLSDPALGLGHNKNSIYIKLIHGKT